MNYIIIFPWAFEVMDAAVAEHLSNFMNGFIEYRREMITQSSVIYHLSQRQLGEVGQVRLRKLPNQTSEFAVREAARPEIRDINDVERAALQEQANRDAFIDTVLKINKARTRERDEQRKKKVEHLNKVSDGLLQLLYDDFIFIEQHRPELHKAIEDFAYFIESSLRSSFWRYKEGKHRWISSPERHAQRLLMAALNGSYGGKGYTLEEINSGAGRSDIFFIAPDGTTAIIELKMCGSNYSSNYAQDGLQQLLHYMENRQAKIGYLIVFDARVRDFGKGFDQAQTSKGFVINTKVIDVRPIVR